MYLVNCYNMCMGNKRSRKIRLSRAKQVMLYLMAYDLIAVNVAYFLALLLRFDLQYSAIPPNYLHDYLYFAPIYTVFCLILFLKCKLYQSIWQYASINASERKVIV